MDSRLLQRKFSGVNLSDYWRTDHSADRASDLASVLEGARAAVSMMEGEYPVKWLSHGSSGPGIWLDPAVLTGFEPPFPGKAVDVVIGLALHEVGHEKWTKPFPRGTRLNRLSSRQYDALLNVHNILEDAYVDTHTGRLSPVLGEYITTARQAFVSRPLATKTLECLREAPNRENVVELWSGISLYHMPFTAQDAHPDMLDAVIHLMDETVRYIEVESNRARADRAWRVFKYIDSLPEPPPPPVAVEVTDTVSSQDVNPWLGDGSEGDGEGSDKVVAVDSESAPALTQYGKDEVEEDWDDGEDEVRDDTADEPDESADAGTAEEPEDEACGGTLGDAEDTGETGKADDVDTPGAPEEDDAGSSAEGDEVSDQLLRNLTEGIGNANTQQSLTELSDFLERRGKGWLTEQEAEDVDSAVKNERRDMAPSLARELGIRRLSRRPYVLQQARYDSAVHSIVSGRVAREVAEMRAALKKIDEVGSRWRYGTADGRLDTRRLAKASTGKRFVYKRRDARGKPATAIALVLDVSGSMNVHLGTVADVAAIFSEALRDLGVWYEVSCYTSGGALVDLAGRQQGRSDVMPPSYTILATPQKPLSLSGVGAGGGTPSGQAVATACIRLAARPERRKVLIHFTDGSPDDFDVLSAAIVYAGRLGISVLTISVLSVAEGNCRVIRDVSELPKATEELLQDVY